jgi:hypothetical protein
VIEANVDLQTDLVKTCGEFVVDRDSRQYGEADGVAEGRCLSSDLIDCPTQAVHVQLGLRCKNLGKCSGMRMIHRLNEMYNPLEMRSARSAIWASPRRTGRPSSTPTRRVIATVK